jgi:hypothetical protein
MVFGSNNIKQNGQRQPVNRLFKQFNLNHYYYGRKTQRYFGKRGKRGTKGN